MAVLDAIRSIEGQIDIHSDSTYVVNCFNDRWYEGWKKRGWKNSQKKPVANRDLWEPLIDLYLDRRHELTFTWVKGHSGNEFNEIADQLAVKAAAEQREANEAAVDDAQPTWPVERAIWIVGVTDPDLMQQADLTAAIEQLDPDADVVVTGLRRGVELEGARTASARGVSIAVVLPFADPARNWPETDRASFDRQIDKAEWLLTLDGDVAAPGEAVERRNRWIGRHVVGAIVVGDVALGRQLDASGVSVVTV